MLQMFDPNTGLDSVLATFPSGYPRPDLVFDPDGKNILVSLYAIGKVGRYNLAGRTATIFPSTPIGLTLDGLAYDPAGNDNCQAVGVLAQKRSAIPRLLQLRCRRLPIMLCKTLAR